MQTRVIVIGAGGAGLTAAIAAAQAGAIVTLLSKTSAGLGGCTAYAGGGFTLASGKVSVAEHRANTWSIGRQVNQPRLLDVLSQEGEQALRTLADWGVTISIGDGHATVSASAAKPIMGGSGFTRELVAIAAKHGVHIRENVVATRLLVGEGRVHGVELVNWQTGANDALAADAVILATGGAGQIYQRTDNPARVTGDGYVLALQAGLPLCDMEFVQFYPLGWAEPGFPQWMIGLPVIDGIRLTDENGVEFLLNAVHQWGLANGREANLYARDRSAQLVCRQLQAGGSVQLHCEEVSESDWTRPSLRELLAFYPEGVSASTYGPVRVAPIQHYFTGGVVITSDGQTEIPGLFACGEVTGGVDGASRIGGNALTNIVTFGLRAGRAAAATSPTSSVVTVGRASPIGGTSRDPLELRQTIQRIVEQGAGPMRDGDGMNEAMQALEQLQPEIPMATVKSARDRLLALELPGLWWSAKAVLQAAALRTESRGVHARSDYPTESDAWQRNIEVSLRDGQLVAK